MSELNLGHYEGKKGRYRLVYYEDTKTAEAFLLPPRSIKTGGGDSKVYIPVKDTEDPMERLKKKIDEDESAK